VILDVAMARELLPALRGRSHVERC